MPKFRQFGLVSFYDNFDLENLDKTNSLRLAARLVVVSYATAAMHVAPKPLAFLRELG